MSVVQGKMLMLYSLALPDSFKQFINETLLFPLNEKNFNYFNFL